MTEAIYSLPPKKYVEGIAAEPAVHAPTTGPSLERTMAGRAVAAGYEATDASQEPCPAELAVGKLGRKSLLQPQELARRLLPGCRYRQLTKFAHEGAPTQCGDPWPAEVISQAMDIGPHVSALTPDARTLLWEDIQYQVDAGFVQVLSQEELMERHDKDQLKISRAAVVPQTNRRDRIILNLSAKVEKAGSRRRKGWSHPSVNETTEPAEDQRAVAKLGGAILAVLRFAYETPCHWEILWQKIDLSDGFWWMIVEAGKELNFVFEMPPKPGDPTKYYVVPSALQMGWKNSPAYFCTATDAGKFLLRRVLAFTWDSGIEAPHPFEGYAMPAAPCRPGKWVAPAEFSMLAQVFVDDFINGVAGEPCRDTREAELLWVARAAMHSVHALFPPPGTLGHLGGKDSISEKKLKKGDARFALDKELLGVQFAGRQGKGRLVSLPRDKADKYIQAVRAALDSPAFRVSLLNFQRVLGKLVYTSNIMPSMKGFFTPLYNELGGKRPGDFVGLGRKSECRMVLEELGLMIELAVSRPSHIAELVGPDLPHIYGTVDASSRGLGGVILPCTKWVQPVVWRLAMPADLEAAVISRNLTMVDCEYAGVFIQVCFMQELAEAQWGEAAGMASLTFTDNSPTAGIVRRQASRANSPMPARTLRFLALRQRTLRSGPQDIMHWPGEQNEMADVPSRSFTSGTPNQPDHVFLQEFSQRFPLPPQLGSWKLVRPRQEICSAAFSLLRRTSGTANHPAVRSGGDGLSLPPALANTLTSWDTREPPSTWNESTCSWPLLLPCGTVVPTAGSPHQRRQSAERFASVDRSWSLEDLRTHAAQYRVARSSTRGYPGS